MTLRKPTLRVHIKQEIITPPVLYIHFQPLKPIQRYHVQRDHPKMLFI